MKKFSLSPSGIGFCAALTLGVSALANGTASAQTAPPASGNGGLLSRISGASDKSEKSTAAPAKASSSTKAQPVAAKAVSKPAAKTVPDKTVVKAALKAEPAIVEAEKIPEMPAVSAEGYTGILIDARTFDIQRTPAPVIYGPEPDGETLYPDIRHVPTPDEVQEASVIRYYYDEVTAKIGFIGSNPLILKAVEVLGPGHDCIRLSSEDAAKLRALDKEIHFTRSWRVGILMPPSR